jgi:uncharacterized protein YaiL (DUF2058 family)
VLNPAIVRVRALLVCGCAVSRDDGAEILNSKPKPKKQTGPKNLGADSRDARRTEEENKQQQVAVDRKAAWLA